MPVEVVYPTAKHQREVWGQLQVLMQQGQIQLPPDSLLRAQLLSLVVVTTATGWRLDDDPRLHQDRALACAGAAWLGKEQEAIGEPMFRWVDTFWGQPKPVNEAADQDSGIMEFEVGETTEQAQRRLLEEVIESMDYD